MRTLYCIICLILSASALASCSTIETVMQKYDDRSYHNPHTKCADCHGTRDPKAGKEVLATDTSMACLNCHKYKENHHPVDFAPARPDQFPFPLYGGNVTCLTCHQIHGGTEHAGTRKLLKGGPYADRREICFQCHEAEEYAGINPHIMFDNDGDTLELNGKPVCLLCHVEKPNPYKDRSANVRFKADIGFLCWRCHPPMPGPFLDKHFLVTPSKKTLSYMRETEARMDIILPLAPWERITCSTCHNPHQKGILTFTDAAKGADAPKKLRTSRMCDACHNV